MPGPIRYAGRRQLGAIHDAMTAALRGRGGLPARMDYEELCEWLKSQGMPDIEQEDGSQDEGQTRLPAVMMLEFMEQTGQCLTYPSGLGPGLIDSGEERSGLIDKFEKEEEGDIEKYKRIKSASATLIIASAFVRLLGAEEQFELDVLKALFYYRPSGLLGHIDDNDIVDVTRDVMDEKPDENGMYEKPSLWTWIRKPAEDRGARVSIFRKVFGISTVPVTGKQSKEWNKRTTKWYDKRNAIVHGRVHQLKDEDRDVTLREYVHVEAFAAMTIECIAKQCEEKLKLIV